MFDLDRNARKVLEILRHDFQSKSNYWFCLWTKMFSNFYLWRDFFVLGPGLGRNQSMLGRISIVIDKCKAQNIPMVIDADGLWHLTNNPGKFG